MAFSAQLPASASAAHRRRELPTFYYHAHFVEMLTFVRAHYGHALRREDRDFIAVFDALDFEAQCLYVRLVNRKGRVFSRAKLRYPELAPMAPCVAALADARLVGEPTTIHLRDLLQAMTRQDIIDALGKTGVDGLAAEKKPALIALALRLEPARLLAAIPVSRYLVQLDHDTCQYLLFLFFGEVQQGTSRFTMRDLGIMRTPAFHEEYEPRFGDRDEALESYYFASRLAQPDTDGSDALLMESANWPDPQFPAAARLRDQLAWRIGRGLEQSGRAGDALAVYERGESLRCFERQVRLLFALGLRDAAQACLEACLDDPLSDEAWLFARDLYERKFHRKRTSSLTDALRDAHTLDLDESHRGQPERAVVALMEQRGLRAFHVENALWTTLTGLLFWDQLFETGDAGLHSPFDWLPASLSDGSFYADRASVIESRLALFGDPPAAKRLLLRHMTRHHGTANGLFRWRKQTIEAVFALVDSGDARAIAAILRQLCKDYRRSRVGYPDLLVIGDDGARFVEIKSDGDQLRRNQLLRLHQLREAGFRAEVTRVRWVIDPAQTYVVVDVETTGGRSDAHRVTEVGAVKLRGGRIVDRFQTLVHPERRIPPNITRLTGISDAMVADAPRFADIAGDLAAFLGDAIFVAHNVDFDYGFISREFRRLGQAFRMPRLCTCASMRKLYPGHRSYSLAALCTEYDIALDSHHRALCDAEAAAQLLLLINQRRNEQLHDPTAATDP